MVRKARGRKAAVISDNASTKPSGAGGSTAIAGLHVRVLALIKASQHKICCGRQSHPDLDEAVEASPDLHFLQQPVALPVKVEADGSAGDSTAATLRCHDLQAGSNPASSAHVKTGKLDDGSIAVELMVAPVQDSFAEDFRPQQQLFVAGEKTALQKVTGRDPAHGNAAGSSAATGHLTDIAVRHAPSGAASLRLPHQPPTSIAASLAEMLESLPTPAECSPAASAQGSYAASLGSIMWVPGDASEQQVTSRAHSSFSSIDLLAHTRRSSLASDQITHQAVTDSYSAALLATASAAFSADPVPQLPDSAADQSCASHLNRKHAPFIAGAPQLSLGAAVPELTANSAAVQQAGFARVMNQQGAYSEACGDRGTSAGPVSMQEEISDLDGLLFSRQASLTNAPAARKFFLKRPFSSSPAGGYSTLMDVQTQHMLADAAVSSQQMLAAAATHPYTDSLSSVFAPATPARQMLMAEGSCDSLRSASDVSAAVPQATGVSESSFVSGQDDLQFLRAYGGFTDKDSSAVVGQPRKTFKLLKIGSLGRKQGHKWGKFKEEQVEAGERENLNTTDNKQKRKMFRKLSDLVNSKLPGIAGGISSANFSMGSKTGLVESAVADGSISGADLISAHHSGVEALPRSPVARASSKLGNLFKRG